VRTIEEALETYFSEEILDACGKCKTALQTRKKFSIERPPKVLFFQLKR